MSTSLLSHLAISADPKSLTFSHKPQLPLSTIAFPILAINDFDGTSEDEAGNDDDDQDG